jgi:glutathione S-transferase
MPPVATQARTRATAKTTSKTAAKAAAKTPAPSRAPAAKPAARKPTLLSLSSKNYSSWSLRGWLMARLAGLTFDEVIVPPDDADARQEILLLSPSILVPCLTHEGIKVWDTLAIGEYLAEVHPESGLLPRDRAARAHCRAICGEMHSGFGSLRSALPMNLKGNFPGHKMWRRADGDVARILAIWRDCLDTYGGPFLFGAKPCMADAMYAPVVTRFLTYHVKLDRQAILYCQHIMQMPEMKEWIAEALKEPEDFEELDMEF